MKEYIYPHKIPNEYYELTSEYPAQPKVNLH